MPDAKVDNSCLNAKGGLPITDQFIGDLSARARALMDLKKARETQVRGLGEAIHALWAQLKVSTEEREAFFATNLGISLQVVAACESELARLQQLRADMLKPLIAERRADIAGLWDKMGIAEEEREDFLPFQANEEMFSEELLGEHEAQVAALQTRYEVLEPIYKLINKRQRLLEDREALAKSLADPTRLTARGRYRK